MLTKAHSPWKITKRRRRSITISLSCASRKNRIARHGLRDLLTNASTICKSKASSRVLPLIQSSTSSRNREFRHGDLCKRTLSKTVWTRSSPPLVPHSPSSTNKDSYGSLGMSRDRQITLIGTRSMGQPTQDCSELSLNDSHLNTFFQLF